ncbi:MAG: AAA family ATPase [Spirulina sp.]
MGKTAVVNEVHNPIARQRGYFIKGKFDQFNRNIPFSAFVQAFRDLMGQLLGESDAELANWKAKILEVVGENGQVLIDVIPELERIIGAQPPVPELSGTAVQNRFNLFFQKFIAVFTTRDHPLTLFLDDLQWADSASLNLMKVLIGDSQMGYLFLLGAYRDNEVFPAHPLMLCLRELEKRCDPGERAPGEHQTTISTIILAPLSVGHINELVAETLSCTVELARPLTELIYQKTRGNPFFTTQFLKGLHEDGLIAFIPPQSPLGKGGGKGGGEGGWECDLVKVRDAALTDDVVEFMAGRLHKFPEATQNVLKLAACIGNQFDLETLAIICKTPLEEVAADLWNALREGLILPQSEAYKFFQGWEKDDGRAEGMSVGYRFLHDRVQQAAYSLIPEAEKPQKHYRIGQLLLKNIPPEVRGDRIFELVGQLNIGRASIERQPERDELAQLNLIAGRKAKNATAYQAARSYVRTGLSLLNPERWSKHYSLTWELHVLAAELASLEGDFPEMDDHIETVIHYADSLLDRVDVYRTRIIAKISQNQLTEAIAIGQTILQQLNTGFPENPTEAEFQRLVQDIQRAIAAGKLDDYRLHSPMSDRQKIATLQIVNCIIPAAYI